MSLKFCRVLAVAFFSGAPAHAESPPFHWPQITAIDEIDVPGDLVWEGIPTRIHQIRVKGDFGDLMEYYAKAFVKAGLYVPEFREQPLANGNPMLVAVDPQRLISYSVMFQGSVKGVFRITLGETNLSALTASTPSDFAPVFPGARGVVRFRDETAEMLTYTSAAPQAEVEAFYRDALGREGYRVADPVLSPEIYVRRGDELQVSIHPDEEGKLRSVLLVHHSRPNSP